MRTDGVLIYSYNMPIGYTDDLGNKVVEDHTAKGFGFVSMTTSVHVNRVKYYADRVCGFITEE